MGNKKKKDKKEKRPESAGAAQPDAAASAAEPNAHGEGDEGGYNWESVGDEMAHFAALAESNDLQAFTRFHVLRLVQGAGAFPVGQSVQAVARRRNGKQAKKLIEYLDSKCGTAADKDLVHPHNDEETLPEGWDTLRTYCENVVGKGDEAYDRHMLSAPVLLAIQGHTDGFMDLCLCDERRKCRVMAVLACAPEWSACTCCSNFFPVYNEENVWMSAAFIAVYHGHVKYLEILNSVPFDHWRENRLVSFLLDADQTDAFHPFRVATQRGHDEVLRYLAAWDPENGGTGHMDMLVMLGPNALGEKIVHIAAREGHVGCLRFFVELVPACVYEEMGDGQTLAHVAADYGKGNVIEFLHEVGAGRLFSQKNRHAITPVHVACRAGHFGVLRQLFQLGGEGAQDVLMQADIRGWTPAHMCAQAGHTACVRELRRLGAQGSFTQADKQGMTPIHHAAKFNMSTTLLALTEHLSPEDLALNVEAQDANGWTPSMHTVARLQPDGKKTASRTCLDAARALHSLGGWRCLAGKVDKRFGRNVAHFVVEHKNRQMMDFFISGADKMPAEYFEVEDRDGRQPIHIAVDARDGVAVVLLRTMKCGGKLQSDKQGQMMCEDWLREFMEFVAPNMGLEVPPKKPDNRVVDGMREVRDAGREVRLGRARVALAKRRIEKSKAEEQRMRESEAARARTAEEADRAAALLLEEEAAEEERKAAAKSKSEEKARKKAEEKRRAAEAAAKQKAEEEEKARAAAETAAKKKKEEKQRKAAEAAAHKQKKEEEARAAAEAAAQKQREEEEKKAALRQKKEQEARAAAEAATQRQREEEERKAPLRHKEEQEARAVAEATARMHKAEEERIAAEVAARRLKKEEERRAAEAAQQRAGEERLAAAEAAERERETQAVRATARERAREELERRHREERERFERQLEMQREREMRAWEERDARELLELERERELEMVRMMEEDRHAPPLVYAPHVATHNGGLGPGEGPALRQAYSPPGVRSDIREVMSYMPWLQDADPDVPQAAGSGGGPAAAAIKVKRKNGEAKAAAPKAQHGGGGGGSVQPNPRGASVQPNPECIVCWERPALCVASPCGHQIMCTECAGIQPPLFSECPMCRVPLDGLLPVSEAQKRGLRVFAI